MKQKILIINLHGRFNIGDQAIRKSAISIIREISQNAQISLLAEEKVDFSMDSGHIYDIEYSPYGYAIRTEKNTKSRLFKAVRLTRIIFNSFIYAILGILIPQVLPTKDFYRFIKWIKDADTIILMGGGYFVSLNKYSDIFGTILNVIPLYIAKLYKKKIIILPISFGPFAHKYHEYISGLAIKNTTVIARDTISLKHIKIYNKSAVYMPDLALYDVINIKNVQKQNFYILTVRECLPKKQQEIFEEHIAQLIMSIWEKYSIHCIFLPMAFNPVEENDIIVAERISQKIQNINIFSVTYPKNPDDAREILSRAKFAICTRMHSAILAANVYTPFICISYQRKIKGFLNDFDLSKWYVTIDNNLKDNLLKKVDNLYQESNYSQFISTLRTKNLELISKRQEIKKYIEILI